MAVGFKAFNLRYATDFRDDRDIVMAAELYSIEWLNDMTAEATDVTLRWASTELQNYSSVVLNAVNQKGQALRWASPEMQNNEEIVLNAVTQDTSHLVPRAM